MASWTIYGSNASTKAVVNDMELHDEWMGECFITVTVRSAEPIDFAVGDYIDYRGERYAIQYDPTVLKKARRGSYGEGFTYDNIKFVHEAQNKVVMCDFTDIVLNDNDIHYTALPTFPFYCETVDDLLDRIQACLDELYGTTFIIIGMNTVRNTQRASSSGNRKTAFAQAYRTYIDSTWDGTTPHTDPYGKQGVAETVDNITCWDALTKVHNDFELNFIQRGYTIVVGTAGFYTPANFTYGKGNGLYEIERVCDSSQQIVTRLRAYGNETNLPTRYYANLDMTCWCNVSAVDEYIDTDIDFNKNYFTYPGTTSGEYNVAVRYNNVVYSVIAFINGDTGKLRINPLSSGLSPSVNDTLVFTNGVDTDKWPENRRSQDPGSELPNNMAVNRLMLPGFPKQSLYEWVKEHRDTGTSYDDANGIATIYGFTGAFSKDKARPYIDSPNISLYGIRPSSIYFDGSNENEDIYPTLTGMGVDTVYSAQQITDNGVYAEGDVPNFTITLPELGFALDEYWQSGSSIDLNDGMCGGRSFEIAERPEKDSNNRWVCKCQRAHDDVLDLWFPYSGFNISAGDHYVLIGIDLPDAYVENASERLLQAAIDALQKNHAPRFTYQPRIDELWMRRQHDTAIAVGQSSIYETLKAGDVFRFSDTDLGITDAGIIIDVLTIKENGNNGLPTYEVTLRDEKQVSTIQKIQNKIDSLSYGGNGRYGSGGGGGGGSVTPNQIESMIASTGANYFLSKISNDTARGLIVFLQGLVSNGQAQLNGGATFGTAGSYGVTNGGDATFDEIFARLMTLTEGLTAYEVSAETVNAEVLNAKAAHFAQLIIDELRSAGGAYLLSAADCTIDFVEMLNAGKTSIVTSNPSFYRCYYKANDNDGRAIYQKFMVDDQVMHTTFDKANAGDNYNISNRYYWMAVDAVSSEPVLKTLEDGVSYYCHWIDLDVSNKHSESNANPEVGDDVVLLGHQGTYSSRQSAIYITAYTNTFDLEVKPPAIVFYQGVNDFTLSGKKPNYWGRDKVVITGQLNYTSTGSGTGTDVATMVGADTYSFWVDKPYQQYSGSGDLSYQMKMTKNGRMVSQADVEEYIARGTASGCSISGISTQNATVTITPNQGVTSGNATIACYTSTTHSNATLWGYVTLSFSKVDTSEIDIDQYAFYLEQDTKTVTCSGTKDSRTLSRTSLSYNVFLEIDGEDENSGPYIEAGSGVNCNVQVDTTNGVLILNDLGKDDTTKTIGGSGTVLCYTDTSKSKLWGVLTAYFNVSWSSFAFNIVDNELTSKADSTEVDAMRNTVNSNNSWITQNSSNILAAVTQTNQNSTDISKLQIQADDISASVASQKYNSNLFGFTNGLSFTGTCVPFIQAYGVEFVRSGSGSQTGTISGFGGASVNGVTISFDARTDNGTANTTIRVAGIINGSLTSSDQSVGNISNSWNEIAVTFEDVTALNSVSLIYTGSGVTTVAVRNLKVETGVVATAFCISDKDGEEIENTNMYTTTVEYNRDPIFMRNNANETLDTSGADGHGSVMRFYRNNSSDPPFMVYNDYIGWSDNPQTKVLTAGKVYTISFWAKAAVDGLRIHTGLYGKVTGSQDETPSYTTHNSGAYYSDKDTDGVYDNGECECLHHLTTSWKRYYARFYIKTGVTIIPIIQCNNGWPLNPDPTSTTSRYLYIADVRLEEGYIADDSDPMSISGARTRSEARMKIESDNIYLGIKDELGQTGIDISSRKITLDSANTEVTGNFTAKKVNTTDIGNGRITMEGGLMQVYNNVFANPQIVFGVDEGGNIVLTYYDGDGNVLWNLGPKGLKGAESQDEEIRTYTNWCIPKIWTNGSWQQAWSDSEFYDIESYCGRGYASPTESFVARILKYGLVTEYGLVYQYDARIVLGNFQAGNYATNDGTAKAYNKLFLNHAPTTSNKLVGEEIQSTGEYLPIAAWWATFMRIVRVEKWLTPYSMGTVTYDERTGKYYSVPDDYIDERGLEHGTDVDFEVLYDGDYTYKDPPVYFYLEVYEYGVFKERGVWYINSSNVFGL